MCAAARRAHRLAHQELDSLLLPGAEILDCFWVRIQHPVDDAADLVGTADLLESEILDDRCRRLARREHLLEHRLCDLARDRALLYEVDHTIEIVRLYL